jgi:hypothetical protein
VKLNKTFYGIKQANREYYEEVFHFIVDHLGLQTSIAAAGFLSGGNPCEAICDQILVEIDHITIIDTLVLVASIACRFYNRFKATAQVPLHDTFRYLGMTVTGDRSKRSISIDQIGYINLVLDRFEITLTSGMTLSQTCATPMQTWGERQT